MEIPVIPSPDSVIVAALGPGVIAGLFLLVSHALSWLGIAKTSVKTGHNALMRVRGIPNTVTALGPVRVGTVVGLTATVLVLQVLWAFLGYYVGNSLSVIFRPNLPGQPTIEQILGLLRWDIFSKTYVEVCLAAVVLSHLWARKTGARESMAFVLSLPGAFYAFFGFAGGALNGVLLLLGINGGVTAETVICMFVMGAAGYCYMTATNLAMGSAGWVRSLWSARG